MKRDAPILIHSFNRKATDMKDLFAAMSKAFPEIEGAIKENENAAFKSGGKASKYADLSSVVNAIKPALAKHGLFFAQMTHEQSGGVCVETVVGHSSGDQYSFGKLFVPASKNDAQGYGSALTYARRYSLMTAFGVCPEDDDGNAAAQSAPPRQQSAPAHINAEQLKKIQTEIDRTGTDARAICKGYNVKALSELNASQFAQAMSALRQRPSIPDELVGDGIPEFGAAA